MPRLDLNVPSRAFENIRAGSRYWFHKKVARLLNCYDYTIITLKLNFQLTGTVKDKQRTEQPCVTTRI